MTEPDLTDAYPVPFPRSYWVIPEKLLAGPYPGSLDPASATQRLSALVAFGIRRVINLMEAGEVNSQGQPFVPYLEQMRAFAADSGARVEWSQHPIRDLSTPDKATMRSILDEIDASLAAGQPVYLHCWGGKGRTGTVVGCYLIRHDLASPENALARINELRQDIQPYQLSPETEAQLEFVRFWKTGE